jgi:transcriptional regulator with XRE-family HTH domain
MFTGANLRNLREGKRLTQDAISRRSGISRSTLSRLESGMSVPSIETLVRLSNSMELPLQKLLFETGILSKSV